MESNGNGNLPEELVNDILLRLPVKALLVCKCVCKAWCALIKSPSFVKRHYSHENNRDYLLFWSYCREDHYAYYMYEDVDSHYRVGESDHLTQLPTDRGAKRLMRPDNGIFCVASNSKRIGLLNPAIREFKILPPHPSYDPSAASRISLVIGLGLDPSSGDFKVVVFQRSGDHHSTFVYNLGHNSWKSIEAVEALGLFIFVDHLAISRILNGVIHWVIKFANRKVPSILGFDMRTDEFQDISIPDALKEIERDLQVTAYGDLLALMSFKSKECVDLWVMGRDGLWSKSFSVGPFQEDVWPLCLWKKNVLFFESSSTPLSMRDVSTEKVTTLIQGTDPEMYVCDHFIYKESLVSLKGEGERADCLLDFYAN